MVDLCELTDPPEDAMKTLEKMRDNKESPTPDVSDGP